MQGLRTAGNKSGQLKVKKQQQEQRYYFSLCENVLTLVANRDHARRGAAQ